MIVDREQTLALLEVIESRKHVTLQLEASRDLAQGIILGGDLEHDILCISETYPDTRDALARLKAENAAHIRMKVGKHYLILAVSFIEHEQDLSFWKIVSAHWTRNKRWQPRACFDAFQAPKVVLMREFADNVSAELHDISESGFSVSIWNKDSCREFREGSAASPHIKFNEHFSLHTEARVIGVSFKRSPCCHTRIRFQFTCLSEVEYSQLHLFISSLDRNLRAA